MSCLHRRDVPLSDLDFEAGERSRHASSAPYYPPPGQWARCSPAQLAMNPELVDSAIAFAKAEESTAPRDLLAAHWASRFGREPLPNPIGPFKPRGDMTGIIVRNGYLVAEWGEPDRVDLTFSVTKSFLSSTADGRDSIELVEAGLTDQYVQLLRDRLSAQDPYLATVPICCEQSRIVGLLIN